MKFNRNLLVLGGVAVLAFVAGRMDIFCNAPHAAVAATPQDEMDQMQIDEEMLAYVASGLPGEHHKLLQPMIGEFQADYKIWMDKNAQPMESTGTVKRQWILGGRFIREEVHAVSMGAEFEGLGYIGYSNTDGHYQLIWMDNMSATIHHYTGTIDPKTGVFTTRGSYRDPISRQVSFGHGTLDMSDPDRHTAIEYATKQDGQAYKSFEAVIERIGK